MAFSRPHQRYCGTGIWSGRDKPTDWRAMESPARLRRPVAKPASHTRAESRGSRRSAVAAGERRTVRWSKPDSNSRSHPLTRRLAGRQTARTRLTFPPSKFIAPVEALAAEGRVCYGPRPGSAPHQAGASFSPCTSCDRRNAQLCRARRARPVPRRDGWRPDVTQGGPTEVGVNPATRSAFPPFTRKSGDLLGSIVCAPSALGSRRS